LHACLDRRVDPARRQEVVNVKRAVLAVAGIVCLLALPRADTTCITIDVSAARHAIDPRIYGLAYADVTALSDLRCPINRWGGNDTTRYNWSINADILGIFGREGLDVARRWTTPASSTPTYKAIKMYRNHEGHGSAFGDVSVAASVPSPDSGAVFAAQRSSDGWRADGDGGQQGVPRSRSHPLDRRIRGPQDIPGVADHVDRRHHASR
jgi:hypothetical protein